MMQKKWLYQTSLEQQKQITALHQSLKIEPVLCEILVKRGIYSYEQAKQFFRPHKKYLYDPFLMHDMQKVVLKIIQHIHNKKKIIFYGDYDVDGTTSVSLMILVLKKLFPDLIYDYYIPDRLNDGYGLTNIGVEWILAQGTDILLLTLDCGIKSDAQINILNNHLVETIIFDHHIPNEHHLPQAYAIINPKQKQCGYPFKELCACGIVFKFLSALIKHLDIDDNILFEYIELVGLATSADIVPLIDENRIFVVESIKKINNNPTIPIKALIQISSIQLPISNHQFVFSLAPRINAAGRIDHANKVVELLLEKDFNNALAIASKLNIHNIERKTIDRKITLGLEENMPNLDKCFSIVEHNENWHKGVLGIIAARMVEKYHKPSIIFTGGKNADDILVGSARGIQGMNLIEILEKCSTYLVKFGGHAFAAGLSLPIKNFIQFKNSFEQEICKHFNQQVPVPEINIDARIALQNINHTVCNIIEQMEPFGPLNMRPIFQCSDVQIENVEVIKEVHLKMQVYQGKHRFKAIFFNALTHKMFLQQPQKKEIIFKIINQYWQGQLQTELMIHDVR